MRDDWGLRLKGLLAVLCLALACCAPDAPRPSLAHSRPALTVSAERPFDLDGRTPRPTAAQQYWARSAFDGTRAFITWFDRRQEPTWFRGAMFGTQVSSGGAVLSPTALLSPSLSLDSEQSIDLVRRGSWWVMSLESGSLAVLDDSGLRQLLDPNVGWEPRLAVGSTRTLVVGRSDLGGTRHLRSTLLSDEADGGLRTVGGVAIVPSVSSAAEGNFAVAATPTGFLVVWQDGTNLLAQRLDLDGVAVGASYLVDATAGPQARPELATRGDETAVVFLTTNGRASLRPISPTDLVGPPIALGPTHPGPLSDVTVKALGTGWVVVFLEQVAVAQSRIFSQRFDGALAPSAAEALLVDDFVFRPGLAVASDGRQLITWGQWNGSGSSAQRYTILEDSGPVVSGAFASIGGAAQALSSFSGDWLTWVAVDWPNWERGRAGPADGRPDASVEFRGQIAGRPGDDELLWLNNENGLAAERRDADGGLLSSVTITLSSVSDAEFAGVLDGRGWYAAWRSRPDTLSAVRLDRDGGVGAARTFPSVGDVGSFSAAANARGELLATWIEPSTDRLRGALVAGPNTFTFASAFDARPAVAALGDRWLVAWVTYTGMSAEWIGPNGEPLDAGLTLALNGASGADLDFDPTVACGPEDCLVAWVSGHSGNWDIVARKAFADGGLGPTFPLLAGPDAELSPLLVSAGPAVWRLAFTRYVPSLAVPRGYVVDVFEQPGPDAGLQVDGGTPSDGGTPLDGGALPDAGGTDGVEPRPKAFTVGCGCGSMPWPGLSLLVLLTGLHRRRVGASTTGGTSMKTSQLILPCAAALVAALTLLACEGKIVGDRPSPPGAEVLPNARPDCTGVPTAVAVPLRRLTPSEFQAAVTETFGPLVPDLTALYPDGATGVPYSTFGSAQAMEEQQVRLLVDTAETLAVALQPGLTSCDTAPFEVCARATLAQWARVGLRRTADAGELTRLTALAVEGLAAGFSPSEALALAASALVQEPGFIYVAESLPLEPTWTIDADAKASRLALTLGGRIPDARGRQLDTLSSLSTTAGLSAEASRWLGAPAGRLTFRRFIYEWLGLRTLPQGHPAEVQSALVEELNRLIDDAFLADDTLAALLGASTGYVNPVLETFYGLPPESTGPGDYRRVTLPWRAACSPTPWC